MKVIHKKPKISWAPEDDRKVDMCIKNKLQWEEMVIVVRRDRTSIQNRLVYRGIRYRPPFLKKNLVSEASPPPPKERLNPVYMAQAWLGKRLQEVNGIYRLDNVPKGFTDIMRETNRLLKNSGLTQIDYNPQWRVE